MNFLQNLSIKLVASMDRLKSTLHLMFRCDQLDSIKHCLMAAGISLDEYDVLRTNYGEDIDALVDEILEKLDRVIDCSEFAEFISDLPDFESYSNQLLIAKLVWFDLLENLLVLHNENREIIFKYRNFLSSKRTQLVCKDKWGDIDQSAWISLLKDFSSEKLVGNSNSSFLQSSPEIVMNYLSYKRANDPYPRYLWNMLYLECDFNNVEERNDLNTVEGNSSRGVNYEYQIRSLIESATKSAVVEMTPHTGDQGADLIVSICNLKIVIQAKDYSGSVGNSAVQEVYAAKAYYSADVALVVTSSSYTPSARKLASELQVLLLHTSDIGDFFVRIEVKC